MELLGRMLSTTARMVTSKRPRTRVARHPSTVAPDISFRYLDLSVKDTKGIEDGSHLLQERVFRNWYLERLYRLTWAVILPTSTLRVCWDGLMIVLIFYVSLTLPFILGFSITDLPPVVQSIEAAVNVLFIVDIWMNFRTAYEDSSRGINVT